MPRCFGSTRRNGGNLRGHTYARAAPAAALAAALLLAGCGDDDGDGSGPPGAAGPDLELDTTGGGIGGGGSSDGAGGGDAWYAHGESADGITLYTTPDGVLYGNAGTGDVCSQEPGLAGSLDWEPVLFGCESKPFASATLRLGGETPTIEGSDRTEEVAKVESLAGQTVDLTSLESTILD